MTACGLGIWQPDVEEWLENTWSRGGGIKPCYETRGGKDDWSVNIAPPDHIKRTSFHNLMQHSKTLHSWSFIARILFLCIVSRPHSLGLVQVSELLLKPPRRTFNKALRFRRLFNTRFSVLSTKPFFIGTLTPKILILQVSGFLRHQIYRNETFMRSNLFTFLFRSRVIIEKKKKGTRNEKRVLRYPSNEQSRFLLGRSL